MRAAPLLLLALAGCQTTRSQPAKLLSAEDQELAGAGFTPAETKAVADTIAAYKALAEKGRRVAHAKTIACLKATVALTGGGAGLFQTAKTYQALVRLAGGGNERDDRVPTVDRSWAIKLVDAGFDLLLTTTPDYFLQDISHFPRFLANTGEGRKGFAGNTLTGLSFDEQRVISRHLVLRTPNMLAAPAYSAVPYRYGPNGVVKYAVNPCGTPLLTYPKSLPLPKKAGPDYLTDAVTASLKAKKGVCYTLFIQRQRDPVKDPIDDPTHEWTGPFEKVGELNFSGPPQPAAACEALDFDAWHAPADNAPIGKVNWLRRSVYKALAKERKSK